MEKLPEIQAENVDIDDILDDDSAQEVEKPAPAPIPEKPNALTVVEKKELKKIKVKEGDNLEHLGFLVTLGCAHIFTPKGKLRYKNGDFEGKTMECNRNQVAAILYNVANTTMKIRDIIENVGVSYSTFLNARHNYKPLKAGYENAKLMRSEILFDTALETAMYELDRNVDSDDFETTKYGRRVDSGAVKYRQSKFDNSLRLAKVYERGVINEKKEDKMQIIIQQKNLTVNLSECMAMSVEDLGKLAFQND